ncbi:MAG: pectin methylesterase [Clostridia bacterium]|nr:pectin methylesterase [Clostridia bacterium]
MHTIHVTPGENALQSAIDRLPADGTPAVIRLAPGVYREKVELRRPNTTIEGIGAAQTRIVWADAATALHADGQKRGTFRTYTLLVLADGCTLQGLTIENAAAPRESVGQCIALFAESDLFTCEDCTLLSAQDTLYTGPLPPREVIPGGFLGPTQLLPRRAQRHIYRRCTIKGDVDFIFGGAAAWFEDCDIVSVNAYTDGRVPSGYAAAASTPEGQKYGYVFHRCRFLAGEGVPDQCMYLGRPWREYAKTVLLHCFIGPHIKPEGWDDWGKPAFHEHGFYAEYGCIGPGSDLSARADFAHVLTDAQAAEYTLESFLKSM